MAPRPQARSARRHDGGAVHEVGRAEPEPSPAHHIESDVAFGLVAQHLARIEQHLREVEHKAGPALSKVHQEWIESARNLVHYVALRQHDLRELQLILQQHGLSSLGRSESFVMASLLETRMRVAEALLARGKADRSQLGDLAARRAGTVSWQTAEFLLHAHTHQALGPKPEGRHVYVMVTAPDAAEADTAWLSRMLRAGMNVLRINTAHEDPAEWTRILAALEAAHRESGLECRVLMDLAGPKIRTGPIVEKRPVATWKLRRDALGRVLEPATVLLRPTSRPGKPIDEPVLLLADEWFADLRQGDVVRFRDTRGKRRSFRVREVQSTEAVAETSERVYVVEQTRFVHERRDRVVRSGRARIHGGTKPAILLAEGDLFVLTGRAVRGRAGRATVVACTLPMALRDVRVGHRVLLDDGAVEGVVERVEGRDLHVRVRRTRRPMVKLRAEKGINFPDSQLAVPSLGAEDTEHLAFVARHADLVGLSFVRSPEDVRTLHATLDALGRPNIGIVLKIETKAGFENLPNILLESMRRPPLAVMIARGDLAVELGFERLAEVQEEMLWLCEASHVPAIWATEVLDTLARTGVPSRAEITDAAASVAAECVMLNKGPHMEEALRALVDILRRMERHHYKKRSMFRRLRVSRLAEDSSVTPR
jgi:pyruvate kinase